MQFSIPIPTPGFFRAVMLMLALVLALASVHVIAIGEREQICAVVEYKMPSDAVRRFKQTVIHLSHTIQCRPARKKTYS